MKENKQHIGIFDSGLGGLTVLKALKQTLPNESFIYFGDTEHLPYGNKSQKSIVEYSLNIAKFLYKKNIKAIVVACNTASAVALEPLKQKYSIPVLNVIDPSITRAVNLSSAQTIGVIGTETTILSQAYQKKIQNKNPKAEVFSKACPLFVPVIEEGLMNHNFSNDIAKFYLNFFKKKPIDSLILGCTHYPLFKKTIQNNMNSNVLIIDSAKETARHVSKYLLKKQLLTEEKNNSLVDEYYVSDKPEQFNRLANIFLNIQNIQVRHVSL